MTKIKSFSRLNTVTEPGAKVTVVNAGLQVFGSHFYKDFQEAVIKIEFYSTAQILCKFFNSDVPFMTIIKLKPCSTDTRKIGCHFHFYFLLECLYFYCDQRLSNSKLRIGCSTMTTSIARSAVHWTDRICLFAFSLTIFIRACVGRIQVSCHLCYLREKVFYEEILIKFFFSFENSLCLKETFKLL